MSTFKIKKPISTLILVIIATILLSNICYANTYSNNSIDIEVTPVRRNYDYGDNVSLTIGIKNKNRYAKLYYKITEIYSGGGFLSLNIDDSERVIAESESAEIEVLLKDKYYKERADKTMDTHITFNNGYYNSKGKMNIGDNAYEITKEEFDEFARYRREKVDSGKKQEDTLFETSKDEKLEKIKSKINAVILIFIIVILIVIILILFTWYIIKIRSRGGYNFKAIIIIFGISFMFLNLLSKSNIIHAADIYNEKDVYNKSISTQVNYANFTCTFDVKVEYYFINTIEPITDLALDTDNDTLPDYLEVLYLTDLHSEDTDGDMLPDGIEIYRTYTDPLRVDTNNNGVNDSDEDYDKDKLTNIEEKNHGTDYDNVDTDFDSISDYDEVNGVKSKDGTKTYITDPKSDDTDSDGLRDDTEIKLGLNPTNPYDANTKVNQTITQSILPKELTIESSMPISFTGELVGDIDENVKVKLSSNNYYDQIGGIIGNPIIIDTNYEYNAGLKITFDLTKYKNIANRIVFCRINDGKIDFVEHTYVNDNILYADCYSGEYCLIDSNKYIQDLNIFLN